MSVSTGFDIRKAEQDMNKIVRKHIKNLPQKQRTFVLTHIRGICLGNFSKESGMLAIRGKFGIRAEVVAEKILADALDPTVTSAAMHPYLSST